MDSDSTESKSVEKENPKIVEAIEALMKDGWREPS